MKRKTISMTIALIVALLLSLAVKGISGAVEVERMTEKLIRLHVVANSDSEYDQTQKLCVRDAVLEYVAKIADGATSKSEAEEIFLSHMDEISAVAENAISESGLAVSVSYENVMIDRREYDGFTLPAGYYDALCVTIGEGAGKNWWCVLYPSLCVSGAMSIDIDDCVELDSELCDEDLLIIKEPQKVKYKLYCYELWQKLMNLFGGGDSKRSLVGT